MATITISSWSFSDQPLLTLGFFPHSSFEVMKSGYVKYMWKIPSSFRHICDDQTILDPFKLLNSATSTKRQPTRIYVKACGVWGEVWVAAENERPCGQPSVSTCVLLCLFASVPLYLCASVLVFLRTCKYKYLVNCTHLCACVLVYLRLFGQPSLSTFVLVRLLAWVPLYLCACVLDYLVKCAHLCSCLLTSIWSSKYSYLVRFSEPPSSNTYV